MRFKISFPADKDDNTALTFPNLSADAIADARAAIEREFSTLAKQDARLLHLALNEAEALAWETGFPQLVFPLLGQEKAAKVASWHERQDFVRQGVPIQAFAA